MSYRNRHYHEPANKLWMLKDLVLCFDRLKETNQKGKVLLSDPELLQTADGRVYEAAEAAISEAEEILQNCPELIEQIQSDLEAYEDFIYPLEY
ncbi:MAG: hypothetical protein LUH07_12725 [Lachnospiraceae bacterium]|nr:hypothetical protein [Lachnospiraceae bacterium]